MSKGFALFADAQNASGFTPNEMVIVGGQTALGDAGQGIFRFSRGASLATGVDVIAVSGGQLHRVTQPNSVLAGLIADAINSALGSMLDGLEAGQSTLAGKFPTTIGAKTAAQSLGVALATDQTVPVQAAAGATVLVSATTPASGTGGTAFPSTAGRVVQIINDNDDDIEYQIGGTGPWAPLYGRGFDTVIVASNASSIAVRRKGTAAAVTVLAKVNP